MSRAKPSGMRGVVLGLCACCLSAVVGQSPVEFQTLKQLKKEAANSSASETQSDGSRRSRLDSIQGAYSTPGRCPNPTALSSFEHQIAYQRTEQLDPFKGLTRLHVYVWQRGPFTAFYVREKLNDFVAKARMTYLFDKHGLEGGGTCPVERNWRECVEGFADMEYANNVVGTCTLDLDLSTIPAWRPSPNNQTKQRIADELRDEIEAKWPGVQEIVVRDFNLKDSQITMYLKMPDGQYYQGCGFRAMSTPHCSAWHLFGTSSGSSVRRQVFDRPYRLK